MRWGLRVKHPDEYTMGGTLSAPVNIQDTRMSLDVINELTWFPALEQNSCGQWGWGLVY